MLRKLSTQKFRGLGDFTMEGLGRVNLLVGANNCGKTSVLEAVSFLLRAGDPWTLWSTLLRRAEEVPSPRAPQAREMDVTHLFEGHTIDLGSEFRISGSNDQSASELAATIVEAPAEARSRAASELSLEEASAAGMAIKLRWSKRAPATLTLPLTPAGGLERGDLDVRQSIVARTKSDPVEFIAVGALSEQETVARLEDVVLTEDEDVLIRALRSIEPAIERIVPVASRLRSTYRDPGARGGVVVKLAGMKSRIPLGSMGDGMWRMLGIALSLVGARGGVLLIDEIDTGLHYTVMEEMWRLVHDAAVRFDVQVFATTHSSDCYRALAAIVATEPGARPEVTIQRIERGKSHAIAFTDDEIALAASSGVEVR